MVAARTEAGATVTAAAATATAATTVISGPPLDPVDRFRGLPRPAWERRGAYRDIRLDVAEGIAKVTISRPEVRNAFRPQTLFELADAFDAGPGRPVGRRGRSSPARDPTRSARVATSDPGGRRLSRGRRRRPPGHRAPQRARPPDPDPPAAQAGGGDGGRLRHRRRPRAPPGVRPHHRRRQRPLRPDRPQGRQLRRRVRGEPAGPHRRV